MEDSGNLINKVIAAGPGWLTVVDSTGQTVTRTGARNWRNNNPGNLINATAAQGVIGRDSYNDPVFATYAQGLEAQRHLLFDPGSSKQNYASKTLRAAMYMYTPPVVEAATGQLGRPDKYIQTIIAGVPGINENTVLSTMTPTQQQQMLAVIHKVEGYKAGKITLGGSGKIGTPPINNPAGTPSESNNPPPSEANSADKTSSGSDIYMIDAPPIPNRLHGYASYIYSLSLHMMTNEEYNLITVNQEYTPKNVIIASAGRHSAAFPRNKNWSEDFYFEDFNLTTIITPNDESRNTNAINCDFSIVEPYGFTMVERILKTTDDLGGKNYLDMPYLVQIDFFAIDDAGEIQGAIPDLQKRFPIKFNKLDIKITERGAEYKINATPFGHSAFEMTSVTVPANMEITARTIADFFQSTEGTSADSYTQAQQKINEQQRDITPAKTNPTPININADSFGSAINAFLKAQQDAGKIDIADIYRFEFLPDPDTGQDVIGSAVFVEDKRNTPKETPMKKNDNVKDAVSMRLSDVGSSQNTYDTSRGIFSINYGTAIDKLLEYVIRNSSYIHDQLVIPDGLTDAEYKARKDAMKDKPLNWFRIIPRVRLLGLDKTRGKWAKEITYSVKPYKMHNLRSDVAPQGTVVTPVKAYNYIFTGKNDDILNLDIQFNTLYYTQQTSNRSKMASQSPTGDSLTTNYESNNPDNYTGSDSPKGTNFNAVMPLVMIPVVQNSKAVATGNPSDAKSIGAADLAESIMSSTQADMIGVKMSIIGDPDYIKQDDVFYGAGTAQTLAVSSDIDSRLLPDGGSLKMDDGGVYVQVLFKVPRDIDDETGFMKYDAGQRNSVFSGLYQVLQVTSTFSKGQFTQQLDLVRLPRQIAFDYVGSATNTSNARPGSDTVAQTPVELVAGGYDPSSAETADTAGSQIAGQDQVVAVTNATEPPTQSADQQDLAAVRASGNTTDINAQNAPAPVPPIPVPTEADNNRSFLDKATNIANRVTDLVAQRNGTVSQRGLIYNSYNRLADQLIAQDPALGDLSDSELQAKNADLANLWAQYKNLLQQQKTLNTQINDTANEIPTLGFDMRATISSSVDSNTTANGPNPIIIVGGRKLT